MSSFKGKVVPGDKLRLETRIIKSKGPVGVGEAVATVDGKVVVSAELTFMVGLARNICDEEGTHCQPRRDCGTHYTRMPGNGD